MHFLYLLTLVASVPYVLAADIGTKAALTEQFRINFATKDNGGCAGYEDILRASYEEAFAAAKGASASISFIQKDPPTDTAGAAKWRRTAAVFSAMFGAAQDTFKFRRGGALNNAKTAFNDMTSDMTENLLFDPDFGNPPASIYCSSSWKIALRPTDDDPTSTETPKKKISETHPSAVNGIYFSIPDQKFGEEDGKVDFADPCQPGSGHLAFTVRGFSAITFCPDLLDHLTDGLSSVKASITEEKKVIQLGDPIGEHRTMAEMWVHEWNHLLSQGKDADAVDELGRDVFDDQALTIRGKSYGFVRIANLAKNNPEAAQKAPDAYAIFANCMFYDNFDWSFGKADPLAENAPLPAL